MSLKIEMEQRNGDDYSRMTIENSVPFESTEVIAGLLKQAGLFGKGEAVESTPTKEVGQPAANKSLPAAAYSEKKSTLDLIGERKEKVAQEHVGTSKTLPYVGNTNHGYSVSEKYPELANYANEQKKETVSENLPPDEQKKNDVKPNTQGNYEGDKWVKVYMDCPSCSFVGERHTRIKNTFAKCPNCDEKIRLIPTTDVRGELDEDGYAFDATDLFLTKQELWEKKNGVEVKR